MTVNINTDIDTQLKQLDEMLKKIELLDDKSKMITFISAEEFAKIRNCSLRYCIQAVRFGRLPK